MNKNGASATVKSLVWAAVFCLAGLAPAAAFAMVPTLGTLTVSSNNWVVDDDSTYTITVRFGDTGGGAKEVRLLINYEGSNAVNPRGYFAWRDTSSSAEGFLADRVTCAGGGYGSKHFRDYNPTAITLVGCSFFQEGDRRRVVFTVRPNPTFGAFGPVHDISARAFNSAGAATSWRHYDLNFQSTRPNDQQGELFGYQGINDEDQLMEVDDRGIPVNLAFLMYLDASNHVHYWRTLPTGQILDYYRNHGVKAVAVFENFLFQTIDDPSSPCTGPTPSGHLKYRLRVDWQARLNEFVTLHGQYFNPQDVAMILMQSEVNDRCALMNEVVTAATAVRQRFPSIPLALSYGASYDQWGGRVSQPSPTEFPDIFDYIGLFSYRVFDVSFPLNSKNATDKYYNPENPTDPSTVYGDLLRKLDHVHQKVVLIFDAHFLPQESPDWVVDNLERVAFNYADFMSYRPEVAGMVGFHWRFGDTTNPLDGMGMSEMPQVVVDAHIDIACTYFPISSPFCN